MCGHLFGFVVSPGVEGFGHRSLGFCQFVLASSFVEIILWPRRVRLAEVVTEVDIVAAKDLVRALA